VSTTVNLWSNQSVGAHSLVSGYITAITNEDFNVLRLRGCRYFDTWDTAPLYAYVRQQQLETQLTSRALDLTAAGFAPRLKSAQLAVIALGRLALTCRSHDLTCVYRGARSQHDCLWFFLDSPEDCPLRRQRTGIVPIGGEPTPAQGDPVGPFGVTGVAIRFFGPKQRHTMEVRQHGYTDWVTVDSVSADAGICFASLLYWYVRATERLPRGLSGDGLFISQVASAAKGGHYNVRSSTLAGKMKTVMEAAGIPLDFKPHSARHAGMAAGKSQGISDDDLCARANMSAGTYKKHYSRQIRAAKGRGAARPSVSWGPVQTVPAGAGGVT
jgi:hypothetical protein